MWLSRALLCVVVVSASFQHQGVATEDEDASNVSVDSLLSRYINNVWSELTLVGMEALHEAIALPNEDFAVVYDIAEKHADTVLSFLQKTLDMASQIAPKGGELDATLSSIKKSVDDTASYWDLRMKGSSEEVITASTKAWLQEFFTSPVDSLLDFLQKPVAGREAWLGNLYDYLGNAWVSPSRKLFITSLNILVDNLYGVYWQSRKYGGEKDYIPAYSKPFLQIQKEFSKMMKPGKSKPRSVYAQRHRQLHEKLIKEEAGLLDQAAVMLTFTVWSFTGLSQVHREIEKECSDKNDLKYTIIEGGFSGEENHVQTIINKANAQKPEACEYYRRRMGENDEQFTHFNFDQFLNLHMSTNDSISPVSSEILMADAIAQHLLGDVEPACMMSFFCHAGLYRSKFDKEGILHPGVDLMLGMLISGRHDFDGNLNQKHVAKIGTPKLAELILKGLNGQCGSYPPESCINIKKFMRPGN